MVLEERPHTARQQLPGGEARNRRAVFQRIYNLYNESLWDRKVIKRQQKRR
jgi:hypothetical protein